MKLFPSKKDNYASCIVIVKNNPLVCITALPGDFTPVWLPLVLYGVSLIGCFIFSLDERESAFESILFVMPFLVLSIFYLFANKFGDKTVYIGVIALVIFMNAEILLSSYPQILSAMTRSSWIGDWNPASFLFPTPFLINNIGRLSYSYFFYLSIPFSFMAGNVLLILGCLLYRSNNRLADTQDGGTQSFGKRKPTAIVLSIFLGGFGIDRIYLGYVGSGVLKLLTWGGFGVWSIIDFILICSNSLKPADGSEFIDVVARNAMPMGQMVIPMATAPLPVAAKDYKRESIEMLDKLHELLERGIISPEEFDEKRKKYMSQL